MSCTYHPIYDPMNGEPASTLSAMINYGSVKDIPCPYCLQAYALHWKEVKYREKVKELEDALEKAIELAKEGLQLAIYGQNNTKHLEGCPSVPMTCMRCVYDKDRERFVAFLTTHGASHE